jgi:RHS repeat-associated protein
LLLRYTGDSNSRSFVPFNGRLLAEYYCGGMIFDHPDEIGSATTATDCTGNLVNEKLYYPFGEFWTGYALPNLGLHQEFAQLPDYDPETDQYNTLARHYSPSGRWMSPDWSAKPQPVPYANFENPQSLNLYAYVQNNPLTGTDPNGHWCILGHGTTCTQTAMPASQAQNSAVAAVATDATTKEEVDAVVKPLVESAEGALENSASKALSFLGDALGVVGIAVMLLDPTQLGGPGDSPSNGGAEVSPAPNPAPAAGGKGVRGGKKDRSLQGNIDQLDGVEHTQKSITKSGGYRISKKKSEQNIDNAHRKIKSLEDVENQ